MSYIDKAYFLNNMSQENLDKLTGGGVEGDTNLANKIKAADSEIDSYVGSVTAVPLDPVPDIIKQKCFDITCYYLHSRTDFMDIPEAAGKKYDAAIEYLGKIAEGKIKIPGLTADDLTTKTQYDVDEEYTGRDMY